MKDINRNISLNIQNYLNTLGMNQRELAARLGCSHTTVSMWIVGDATPRMDKIDKMCDIFHCTRDDLVGETVKDPADIARDRVRSLFIEQFDNMNDSQRLRLMAYMNALLKENPDEE